jgi:hypothetical protein
VGAELDGVGTWVGKGWTLVAAATWSAPSPGVAPPASARPRRPLARLERRPARRLWATPLAL